MYPSQSKLRPDRSSKLLVRVIEATDLPRADVLSKSDPFVKAKVKGFFHRTRKTSYISVRAPDHDQTKLSQNTSNPVWNQEFVMHARKLGDVLNLKVYDHDVLSKDDLLGIVNVPLSKYMMNKGQVFDEWVPLMKKRRIFGGLKPARGQVHLQFMYGSKKAFR